jgi:hypothetical protein
VLLSPGYDEIVGLLGMRTADVAPIGPPLFIVGDGRGSGLKVSDQLIELSLIAALRPTGFKVGYGIIEASPPKTGNHSSHEAYSGLAPLADHAGQFIAFMAEMIPVENKLLGREVLETLGEEVAYPPGPIA